MIRIYQDEALIPTPQTSQKHSQLKIALVYPDSYYIGMSNLGFQTILGLIAERTPHKVDFYFWRGDAGIYRHPSELRKYYREPNLREYDILAFSTSYEFEYFNIYRILKRHKIPVLACQRETLPLVIAGGYTMSMNPEPLGNILDLAFVGEGEKALEEFLSAVEHYLPDLRSRYFESARDNLVKEFREARGFYFPSHANQECVVKNLLEDVNSYLTVSRIVARQTAFKNMMLMEIARGCAASCTFCMAGNITKPLRMLSYEELLSRARLAKGICNSIGVISASPSDHPEIKRLARTLVQEGFSLSFSSLRLSTIDDEMLECLLKSGQRTVTIAPEVLDEHYRRIIKKPYPTNEKILKRTRDFLEAGVPHIKFYFMLGYDFETDEYIKKLGEFLSEICAVAETVSRRKRPPQITFSFSFLVPKPQTVYELSPMASAKEMRRRKNLLLKHTKGRCEFRFENEESAILQEKLSRGGRDCIELFEFFEHRQLNKNSIRQAIEAFDLETSARNPRLHWKVLELYPHNPNFLKAVREAEFQEVAQTSGA